jgi:phenylpyruvate tautomerase PptA (4-oxalocrotonate tautomerase family)
MRSRRVARGQELTERRTQMPICYIEAPPGISPEAKKKMMEKITAAIDEGYNHIGETFVFLHEDKPENVMMNGRFQSENPKFADFVRRRGA